jgi:hypothetical protein
MAGVFSCDVARSLASEYELGPWATQVAIPKNSRIVAVIARMGILKAGYEMDASNFSANCREAACRTDVFLDSQHWYENAEIDNSLEKQYFCR